MLENIGNRLASSAIVGIVVFAVVALVFWGITFIAHLPFNWLAIAVALGVLSAIGYLASKKVLF